MLLLKQHYLEPKLFFQVTLSTVDYFEMSEFEENKQVVLYQVKKTNKQSIDQSSHHSSYARFDVCAKVCICIVEFRLSLCVMYGGMCITYFHLGVRSSIVIHSSVVATK